MAKGIARSAGIFTLPKTVSLEGSKLYFYQTGTSTPVAVYTDIALTVAHTQPVVADSAGRFAPIYISGETGDLRVSHYTSTDVLIYTVDGYPASLGTTSSIDINDTNNPLIQLVQSGATANNKVWYVQASGQQFKMSLVNDAFSIQNDWLTVSRSLNTATQVNLATDLFTLNSDQVATGACGVKIASSTISSSTTLTQQNDLTVSLIGSSYYVLDVNLYFNATTTAGMGIKLDVTGSGGAGVALNGVAGPGIQFVNGAGSVVAMNAFPATPYTAATISTAANDSLQFSVPVVTTTAGTMFVRIAQNSSSVNALNILKGSSIRARRVGDN